MIPYKRSSYIPEPKLKKKLAQDRASVDLRRQRYFQRTGKLAPAFEKTGKNQSLAKAVER